VSLSKFWRSSSNSRIKRLQVSSFWTAFQNACNSLYLSFIQYFSANPLDLACKKTLPPPTRGSLYSLTDWGRKLAICLIAFCFPPGYLRGERNSFSEFPLCCARPDLRTATVSMPAIAGNNTSALTDSF
jgi:hypothetical protein